MAIKFEKKVILGSVTSFIVAAIGVIAVFFPDLFNLQKKKIPELAIALDTKDDFDKLEDFLFANQDYIVKLTLMLCSEPEYSKLAETDDDCDADKDVFCIGIPADDSNRGSYHVFDNKNIKEYNWRMEVEGLEDKYCKNSPATMNSQISGYFLYKTTSSSRDTDYSMYDSLSEREVKLKEY